MCIGVWTLSHPEYALILGSNRDEFLSRPTLDAEWHSFGDENTTPSVLSGLDVLAGGTWLGMNRRGDIAMLTNITENYEGPHLDSRGDLAREYLLRPPLTILTRFRETTRQLPSSFRGIQPATPLTQIYRSAESLEYDSVVLTNLGAGGEIRIRQDREVGETRVEAQSNAIWPDKWEKVIEAESRMAKFLDDCAKGNDESTPLEEDVCSVMRQILDWKPGKSLLSRAQLRTTIFVKPLPLGPKQQMYATRDHTIILVHRNGRVYYLEQDVYIESEDIITHKKTSTENVREFSFDIDRSL